MTMSACACFAQNEQEGVREIGRWGQRINEVMPVLLRKDESLSSTQDRAVRVKYFQSPSRCPGFMCLFKGGRY